NTSVARPTPDPDGRVRRLSTTQLPELEVPRVEHVPFDDVLTRMAALAKLDGDGLERSLSPLIEAYARWIDDQSRAPLPREAPADTRHDLMVKASKVLAGMREGVDLLKRDAQVREACKLANRAMHVAAMQADSHRVDGRYKHGREP